MSAEVSASGRERPTPQRLGAQRIRRGAAAQDAPTETQEKKKEQAWHVSNFWIAYDACEE
jgi:hypothetical protein